MDSPLRLRPSTRRDWRALRDLRLEALRDTPSAYGSTYAESKRRSWREWKEFASSANSFVAERESRFVAMARGGWNEERPGTAWLYGMYVTPAERGTGLAERLVERVVQWARSEGFDALYLQVGAAEARARAFYRKVGFVETGEHRAMARDSSIDILTMRREIRE